MSDLAMIAAMIGLLVFIVGLIFLMKKISQSFFESILKAIVSALLLAAVVGILFFAVRLVKSLSEGLPGSPEAAETGAGGETDRTETEAVQTAPEDCIILRQDQIWIGQREVDREELGRYIDERVESNTEITIVDDYALSALHHEVTRLCEEKGAKHRDVDETWLQQ